MEHLYMNLIVGLFIDDFGCIYKVSGLIIHLQTMFTYLQLFTIGIDGLMENFLPIPIVSVIQDDFIYSYKWS